MEDAAPLFGLAAVLGGVGFVIRVSVAAWIQLKQFERQGHAPHTAPDTAPDTAPARDAELFARLARVEQGVEATAVEIERLAEAHRYTARLLSEPRAEPQLAGATPAAPRPPAPEMQRVITPH